ncbi:MAG: cell division protein ZapE [Cypionkella sp.]|nr:cell division protein ZapE [Cypionkella sp.]
MTQTLHQLYAARLASGALRADPVQQAALQPLERVRADLTAQQARPGWPGRLWPSRQARPAIRGVYLWGDVGRGKSMLMDMLIASLPGQAVRRVHFHAFLRDLHRDVHASQQAGARDAITTAVDRFAKGLTLLALDEMDVSDIADAMIVDRVFRRLLDQGTVIVTTSNRPPDQLYREGLKRDLFLPFIDLLQERLDVVHLESATDWRRVSSRQGGVFLSPLTPATAEAFDSLWRDAGGGAAVPGTFIASGRRIDLGQMAKGALRATFADLCDTALGPGDYLEIADRCHTVFLDDVPQLAPSRRDAARRFVMLTDALYEARRRLILRSATEVDALLDDALAYLGTRRLLSRLAQMQSAGWPLSAPKAEDWHLPTEGDPQSS